MDVIFHGVRGSTPTADQNFLKYGGSTTCTEILHEQFQINKLHLVVGLNLELPMTLWETSHAKK